jgi:hypothetical protein
MESVQGLIEKIKVDIQEGKSDEEIFYSFRSLFGKDPEFDGQLAESLATLSDAKTGGILQHMLKVSGEKKVQKMIKRSLYRLKSKGIPVEEVSPDRKTSILHPIRAEAPKGFGNGYDFSWNRFLLLAIPRTGRGLTVMHGLISDEKGLLDCSGAEMSRKEFREFFEKVQKVSPTPMVEMEASYIGFLLSQAHQLMLEKGGTPPPGYLHLKKEVEKVKKDWMRPLIYSYLHADEIQGEDRVLGRGADLLKDDLFYIWRIEEDLIRRYADEIREAEESKIVLHPTQKEARFQGIYQKALSELFSGERRFLYKRRLEEMAYLLFKLGKEDEARLSLAVALDLEKPLNLIQPNPFLLQLIVKSIFALLAEADEKRAKEPSLIVKP